VGGGADFGGNRDFGLGSRAALLLFYVVRSLECTMHRDLTETIGLCGDLNSSSVYAAALALTVSSLWSVANRLYNLRTSDGLILCCYRALLRIPLRGCCSSMIMGGLHSHVAGATDHRVCTTPISACNGYNSLGIARLAASYVARWSSPSMQLPVPTTLRRSFHPHTVSYR